MRTFDQATFSLIKGRYPTERGRIKAIREIGNAPIEATLRRLTTDERPREQSPKEAQSLGNQRRRERRARRRAERR